MLGHLVFWCLLVFDGTESRTRTTANRATRTMYAMILIRVLIAYQGHYLYSKQEMTQFRYVLYPRYVVSRS